MISPSLLDYLRDVGPLESRLICRRLADYVYEAELRDATDFAEWLREVAEAIGVGEKAA